VRLGIGRLGKFFDCEKAVDNFRQAEFSLLHSSASMIRKVFDLPTDKPHTRSSAVLKFFLKP
jgi:hypothetical protein